MSVRLRSLPVPFDPAAVLSNNPRFELIGELGRGASAVVYDVNDRERGEHCALKIHFRKDARTREALATELQISREIAHPNLVRIYETGQLEDSPYLLMERVAGPGLLRYVRDASGALLEERLRHCLAQLVSAVHALHAAQRVHRDVKPSNIRVAPDGRLVLLDLGIAAERGDLVWAEPGIGTPAYMAPEQVTGGIVGPPADLYAVGVVLYEVLTGTLPHPESARGQTQVKLSSEVVRPSALRKDIPEDLDALCADLLARDPEMRPEAGLVLKILGHGTKELSLRVPLHHPTTLAGREELLERLEQARRRAEKRGHWVYVEGPHGRGKRALLRHFAARLEHEQPPTCVWRGRFHAPARSAHDGLDGLIQGLSDQVSKLRGVAMLETSRFSPWLGQMFPTLRFARNLSQVIPEAVPVPDLLVRRARALTLLRDLVTAIAQERPVLAWLDRTELASDEALATLEHAFLDIPNVLVVMTGLRRSFALPSGREPERLNVPPLPEAALLEMVDEQWVRSLGELAPDALSLARASEGEPWAVLELARAHMRGECTTDGTCALQARVASLPAEARHMLHALAVAGRDLPQHVWLEVSALEERVFHRHLFALLEAALIERVSDWLFPAFGLSHEPLRHLLLAQLSAEERRELHRSISLASARHGDVTEDERAAHLDLAGHALEAARSYEQLSDDAEARLAFARAAALRRRALELDPPRERHGAERLRRLGLMLTRAGRLAEAAEAFTNALAFASPADSFELRRLRTEALLRAGRIHEGLRSAHEGLDHVGLTMHKSEARAAVDLLWQKTLLSVRGTRFRPKAQNQFSPHELSRIDALLGMSLMLSTVDVVRGAELQVRGLRFALKEREPLRVARALALSVAQEALGEPEPHTRSRALLGRAREIPGVDESPALSALFDLAESSVQLCDMHPQRALELSLHAERRLVDACVGESFALGAARLLAMASLFLCGSLHDLEAHVTRTLADAREQGDRLLSSMVCVRGMARLALLMRDSPDEAEQHVREAMALWPRDRLYIQHFFAALIQSSIAEYRKNPGGVAAHDGRSRALQSALFVRLKSMGLALDAARVGLLAVEAARAHGSERRARQAELTSGVEQLAQNAGIGMARFFLLSRRPAERYLAGDLEGTVNALMNLREFAAERGLLLTEAQAALASAMLAGGQTDRAQAEAKLKELGVLNVQRVVEPLLPGFA